MVIFLPIVSLFSLSQARIAAASGPARSGPAADVRRDSGTARSLGRTGSWLDFDVSERRRLFFVPSRFFGCFWTF